MALQQVINYDTAGNFTFDSDYIEFSGSVAQHKAIALQGDEAFVASFYSDINLIRGGGTLTTTATGGASVSGNKLDLTGGTVQYVDVNYDNVTNPDPKTGCIRFKYEPAYSGSPAASRPLFDVWDSVGVTTTNRIAILHQTNGTFLISLYSSSAAVTNLTTSAWSPTAGTTYEIEFNWDMAGTTRLYIDGTEFFSNATTITRTAATLDVVRIGGNLSAFGADAKFSDFQYFTAVQHTSNFTGEVPREVGKYVDSSIEVNTGIDTDGISAFAASVSEPTGSSAGFALRVGSDLKYWDGAAWSASNGTTEVNTAADINTNIGSLDLLPGQTVKVYAYLNTNGNVQASITSATVDYSFFSSAPTLDTAVIYGYIYDNTTVVNGAKVHFKSKVLRKGDVNFAVDKVVTTRSNGYFELELPRTEAIDGDIDVIITYTNSMNNKVKKEITIQVPTSGDSATLQAAEAIANA